MAGRTAPLLRALAEVSEVRLGNPGATHIRHLKSCGILATQRASCPPITTRPLTTPCRSFINLAAPLVTRRIEHSESQTFSYSPEQVYDMVASVDQYEQFVPWCTKSRVVSERDGEIRAQLEIGFPPVVERYTSLVTVVPNHQVRAVCTDASLFKHLETVWRFSPVSPSQAASCKVDFHVSFEFKSLLHSQLAMVFFDEVVKQMVGAFEKRAAKLYGPHGIFQKTAVRSKKL
ncbi:hypothetical protein GN956_G2736 [Arapaima gigas]